MGPHLRLGRIGSRLACMEGMGGDLGGSLGASEGGGEGRSFPLGSGHMTREPDLGVWTIGFRCFARRKKAATRRRACIFRFTTPPAKLPSSLLMD